MPIVDPIPVFCSGLVCFTSLFGIPLWPFFCYGEGDGGVWGEGYVFL